MERRVWADGSLRTITLTRTYPTTVEDLWSACTSPSRIGRWFLPVTISGCGFQLKDNAHGTLSECDPPTSFRATWEYSGDVSWISVRLSAVPSGARLELQHTVAADAKWSEFGPGAPGVGWEIGLLRLSLFVAGQPIEEESAWAATPSGQAFMASAAQGWGAAHAASGADRAIAEAAAARTAAGYGVG